MRESEAVKAAEMKYEEAHIRKLIAEEHYLHAQADMRQAEAEVVAANLRALDRDRQTNG